MATKKEKPQRKPERFFQELPVKLTQAELDDRRHSLVDVETKLDQLAAEKERANDAFNDRKSVLVIARKTLLEAINAAQENRQVECEKRVDFVRNREVIIRTDTDEQVNERALEGEERAQLAQEPLLDGDQVAGKKREEPRA